MTTIAILHLIPAQELLYDPNTNLLYSFNHSSSDKYRLLMADLPTLGDCITLAAKHDAEFLKVYSKLTELQTMKTMDAALRARGTTTDPFQLKLLSYMEVYFNLQDLPNLPVLLYFYGTYLNESSGHGKFHHKFEIHRNERSLVKAMKRKFKKLVYNLVPQDYLFCEDALDEVAKPRMEEAYTVVYPLEMHYAKVEEYDVSYATETVCELLPEELYVVSEAPTFVKVEEQKLLISSAHTCDESSAFTCDEFETVSVIPKSDLLVEGTMSNMEEFDPCSIVHNIREDAEYSEAHFLGRKRLPRRSLHVMVERMENYKTFAWIRNYVRKFRMFLWPHQLRNWLYTRLERLTT